MVNVLSVGGLTIDWLQTSSTRHGPALGGNAAYAAVGAHLAGADASVVAVIGDDYPDELLEQLKRAGIDTTHVRLSAGSSFRVLLDESRPSRRISYLPGSGRNDRLDPIPAQLPDDMSDSAVHICGIPPASQRSLLDASRERAVVTTIDTVIIPDQIDWPGDVEATVVELHKAGVARVVVKLGADGSIGVDDDGVCWVPAVATTVVDPTGAGDAYCGAFCAVIADGADLRTAMAWGAAAASVVIEDYGAAHALVGDSQARAAERAKRLRGEAPRPERWSLQR